MLFCVGEFFGADNSQWTKYKTGSVKVPIATFVLGANTADNDKYFDDCADGELCPNVSYLGQCCVS